MKSWGFTYKTIAFVWIKKTVNGKTVNMLAPWTLKGAEICILGTRGAMTKHKAVNNVKQVHEALRREHSRKPDIIRDEIARMFPDCRKIELFARTAMPGWDAWGNEVDKFVEPETVPEKTKGLW
jgi:site-specific DNA-methyltransferase (adenine-specific)